MISYLDNAATTLPCKAAAEAMERATREIYGKVINGKNKFKVLLNPLSTAFNPKDFLFIN